MTTAHTCRLPTQDQLRARVQGLMDMHDIIQADLAGWLGCYRLSIHRRFTGWRGMVLTVEDAREMAAAVLLRANPQSIAPELRADLYANVDELLAVPQISEQQLRALAGTAVYAPKISGRRVAGLIAEGLLTDDWQLTAAGQALLSAQDTRLIEIISQYAAGIRAAELSTVTGWDLITLRRYLQRVTADGRVVLTGGRYRAGVEDTAQAV